MNALQVLATLERAVFDSFQCGREEDVFQRAVVEDPEPHFAVVRIFVRTQHLETVAEFCRAEALAPVERPLADSPERGRELDALKLSLLEGVLADLLEPLGKVHFRELMTVTERCFPNASQSTSLFNNYFLQVLATVKRGILNFYSAFRNKHPFIVLFLVFTSFDYLSPVWHHQRMRVIEHLLLNFLY